ncbi:MAG: uroporphyrinogen-III C-methyltransferase, partial [Planctomycetes bacterium]|nr:uroporphyrinogen-III C-methyltransferase [Planctomycetota bacterium]
MNEKRGIVYLVGAGPGDPELITVRGLKLLRRADVVIHDRLIGQALLKEAPHNAEIVDVGNTPGDHRLSQLKINSLMV